MLLSLKPGYGMSGHMRHSLSDAPDNVNNYKYGFYAAGNVFYNISSYLQVGVEYLYGRRGTWNAGSALDNRLQMQIMFTL